MPQERTEEIVLFWQTLRKKLFSNLIEGFPSFGMRDFSFYIIYLKLSRPLFSVLNQINNLKTILVKLASINRQIRHNI